MSEEKYVGGMTEEVAEQMVISLGLDFELQWRFLVDSFQKEYPKVNIANFMKDKKATAHDFWNICDGLWEIETEALKSENERLKGMIK